MLRSSEIGSGWEVADLEGDAVALRAQIREREAQVREKEALVKEKDREVAELVARCAARDDTIDELRRLQAKHSKKFQK